MQPASIIAAADRLAGDSVTAVAYWWGFSRPSRFAAYYRAVYGVPPGDTLRRGPPEEHVSRALRSGVLVEPLTNDAVNLLL
jgi:AraC-like DNA-binding protein